MTTLGAVVVVVVVVATEWGDNLGHTSGRRDRADASVIGGTTRATGTFRADVIEDDATVPFTDEEPMNVAAAAALR